MSDSTDEEGEDANSESNEKNDSSISAKDLENVYRKIMDDMEKKVPLMVKDVRILLTELRRLVLLWDELWMCVLQQLHPQVEQLVQKLQAQAQKLSKKVGIGDGERKQLLKQHLRVSIKPVRYIFCYSNNWFNNVWFVITDSAGSRSGG